MRTAFCGFVNGRVEATSDNRERLWSEWKAFCRLFKCDPYLDGADHELICIVVMSFAGMLRKGRRGKPVSAKHVQTQLGHINTKIALDRNKHPLKADGKGDAYLAPIQHMIDGWGNFDPPVVKKLACHPDLPTRVCLDGYKGAVSQSRRAVGDLTCIAFYYLLRVGEYTTTFKRKRSRKKRRRKRTIQFRLMDVTFFKRTETGMIALPATASDEEILAADAATLRISNQKNGHAGACVHHHAIGGDTFACPVRAVGRRVAHIRTHCKSGEAMLCDYWDDLGEGHVTDVEMRKALKFGAGMLKYPEKRGIPIERVDTHSLRSGGACALKLSGHSDVEIKKMGRWAPRSTSFLEYIQQQLSTFTDGMSSAMSTIASFTNMEGTVTNEDRRQATIF